MKQALTVMLLFCGIKLFAQSTTDTTTILYDYSWRVIETGYPSYIGQVWKEGNKWHKRDIYYPESIIQKEGLYADKDFKVQDGLFTWYHRNGMMSDSCLMVGDLRQGTELTWDKEGNQTSLQHWHNNVPVDTAVWWNSNNAITAVRITDSAGNGFYQQYLSDGKTPQIRGNLYNGKRSGKWIFKDKEGIMGSEAVYTNDSVVSVVCYNEQGMVDETTKNCVIEKPAAFKGGADGWRRYLERNLKYPDDAYKQQIQGVVSVQFNIAKDGTVSDIVVLKAPSESLGKEGMRMIKQSPKWEPALQYNRPVIYRQIQSITFALQ
jgi:TonB family protein